MNFLEGKFLLYISDIIGGGSYDDEKTNNSQIIILESIKIPDIVKPLIEAPVLPDESILFHNYIFHAFDTEDFTNITYLEELFYQKLKSANTFSGDPEIINKGDIIEIIGYKEFCIKITKDHISDKITRNSMVITLTQEGKAMHPGNKSTIMQLFLALRKFDGFIFEYIDDNLKIDKNKDLRKRLNVSNEETRETIKNDLNTLESVSDSKGVIVAGGSTSQDKININDIHAIKRNLSGQFGNATAYYRGLHEKAKLLIEGTKGVRGGDTSEEMQYFNQIVIADFTKGMVIMSDTIERLENDMISVAYAKDHKDIVDRMQMNLEGGEIVSYRTQESKIMYGVKNTTEKVLSFFGIQMKDKKIQTGGFKSD